MKIPKDYPRKLMISGKREKANCFFEYCFDVDDGKNNSIRFYAISWNKQKTTVERWIKEFKNELEKHAEYWENYVDSSVDSSVDTKTPKKRTSNESNVDSSGTVVGQRVITNNIKEKNKQKKKSNSAAENISAVWKENIGGAMSLSVENISYWLKEYSAEDLLSAIEKYSAKIKKEQTSKQYIKKCSNFFGRQKNPYFVDYIPTAEEKQSLDLDRMIDELKVFHTETINLSDGSYLVVNAGTSTQFQNGKQIRSFTIPQTYKMLKPYLGQVS